MSEPPLISVVIATFNRSQYLPETIESVLAQRFQSFELIVVDDGSTDGTRKVLESYGSRLQYIYRQNGGPSAARNLGVQHARGNWIAFQDSDDISTPDHLSTLYNYVEEHQDCGMVFANGGYYGEAEQHRRETIIPTEKSRRLARNGVRLGDLFEKSIVRFQASLISKRCYEAVGGHDENLRIAVDLDLSFRLFMRYPVAYLDKVVFYYRKHEGSIGRNEELRQVENIRVIEKLLGEHPYAEQILGSRRVAHRLAYRYYRLAKGRWKDGQKEKAKEALNKAVALCPLDLKYRLYRIRWG